MSDIAIRFDGLLLGAFMLGGVVIFVAIGVAAMLRTLIIKPVGHRTWSVASRSAWFAVAHAVGLAILLVYLTEYGAPISGTDWLDWLALPWVIFTVFGLVLVFRSRTIRDRRDC